MDDLIRSLQSPKRRIRQAAIRQIITLKAPEAIPHLRHILLYDDDFLKREAAQALGQIGEPAVPALLEGLKSENKVVRRYAAEGLGAAKNSSTVPLLTEILLHERFSDYWPTAYAITVALGKIGDSAAVPALIQSLKEGNVREQAADALSKIKDTRAIPALFEALSFPENNLTLRRHAAWGIGNIGDPRTIPMLLTVMADPDLSIREAIISALGQIKDKGITPYLTRIMLDSREDDRIRRSAISALAKIKDPTSISMLLEVSSQKNIQYSNRLIAWCLAEISTPEALAGAGMLLLAEVYEASNRDSRQAIIELGRLGAVDVLSGLLQDEATVSSFEKEKRCDLAAEALRKIGTPEALVVIEAWEQGRE